MLYWRFLIVGPTHRAMLHLGVHPPCSRKERVAAEAGKRQYWLTSWFLPKATTPSLLSPSHERDCTRPSMVMVKKRGPPPCCAEENKVEGGKLGEEEKDRMRVWYATEWELRLAARPILRQGAFALHTSQHAPLHTSTVWPGALAPENDIWGMPVVKQLVALCCVMSACQHLCLYTLVQILHCTVQINALNKCG